MTDKHNPLDDAELESLFAAARTAPEAEVEPGAELLSAILADADALQPGAATTPRRNRWRDLADALGGWMGMGGLVAASAAGLAIGIATPDLVGDVTAYLNGTDTFVDAGSGFGAMLDEG